MQILRYLSLTEPEYAGCVSAFVDSLTGELSSASSFLRRLEGTGKGAAFSYEMSFDRGRYGALVVLDRWRHLHRTFATHLGPGLNHPALQTILEESERRVTAGETILARANDVIDAAGAYHGEVTGAVLLAFEQVRGVFREEIAFAEQTSRLGPMLSDPQKIARDTFLADLAHR